MSKPLIWRGVAQALLLALLGSACAVDQAQAPMLAATDDAGDIKHERDVEAVDVAPEDAASEDAPPSADVAKEDAPPNSADVALDAPAEDTGAADVAEDAPPACEPTAEVCDGADNDCDGQVDEDTLRMCDTACGAGTQRCVEGDYVACEPTMRPPEVCDGADNDCDGRTDEGVTRVCFDVLCENRQGAEVCAGGSWSGRCVVPEEQDANDNDCDGETDEGVQVSVHTVTWGELDAARGGDQGCDSAEDNISFCLTASHRWCRDAGFQTGIGVGRHDAQGAEIACLTAQHMNNPTWAELSSGAQLGYELTVAAAVSRITWEASYRFCTLDQGQVAGVGPVEFNDDGLWVLCPRPWLARSIEMELPRDRCAPDPADGVTTSGSIACGGWVDQACRDRGFEFGYGPITFNAVDQPQHGLVVCISDDAALVP